jgi:hypothetical protein
MKRKYLDWEGRNNGDEPAKEGKWTLGKGKVEEGTGNSQIIPKYWTALIDRK